MDPAAWLIIGCAAWPILIVTVLGVWHRVVSRHLNTRRDHQIGG